MKSDSFTDSWALYWMPASQKFFHGQDVMKNDTFREFFINVLVNRNSVSLFPLAANIKSQDIDRK